MTDQGPIAHAVTRLWLLYVTRPAQIRALRRLEARTTALEQRVARLQRATR